MCAPGSRRGGARLCQALPLAPPPSAPPALRLHDCGIRHLVGFMMLALQASSSVAAATGAQRPAAAARLGLRRIAGQQIGAAQSRRQAGACTATR